MSSGVSVAEDAKAFFDVVKMKKSLQNYLVLKMSDDKKQIVVDTAFNKDESQQQTQEGDHSDHHHGPGCKKVWAELLDALPEDDARYVIFDYDYKPPNRTVDSSKLIFLLWCPSGVSVKTKMLYASSKDAAKDICGSGCPMFQADCKDDCDDKEILSKVCKF